MRNEEYKKLDKYDSITENDIPETEEFTADSYSMLMSFEEYCCWKRFENEHKECMRRPDGSHRFGTIGGGMDNVYYLKLDGSFEIVANCYGCNSSVNLTEQAKNNQVVFVSDEEKNKMEEKYKRYSRYPDRFNSVENLRFKAFVKDHPNGKIRVGFMGTGLGYLINVKDEVSHEMADITDTTHW